MNTLAVRYATIAAAAIGFAACATSNEPIVIELDSRTDVTRMFDVDGARDVRVVASDPLIGELWLDGGAIAGQGLIDADRWFVPQPIEGERTFVVAASGEVALRAWGRGAVPPAPTRERSATWFDATLLDDATFVSFARVMSIIAGDGNGGALLERWFETFAAGPGAGRATFAQFLDGVRVEQGVDPRGWDLAKLPFKVTGVHNRIDLARGDVPGAAARDCGELRVSIASTHPTLAPLHLLFIFRQLPQADDATPDGAIHCRGTARRWAALAGLSPSEFASTARAWLDAAMTRENFALAESVELTISPWQWRQWVPTVGADGAVSLANPPLFQTIDVARVNTPGAIRDAFLVDVAQHRDEILARTWAVPAAFRPRVAEVQPTEKAALVDLSGVDAATGDQVAEALGAIGCPRCHTDNADFVQTSVGRVPSPFYDKELDARTARINALAQGRAVTPAPFGPLQ
ncbi:MAG TPA: hypothetical protein VMZ53_17815 [Kofleriaceae bacterium]|nr:hypothetical protein [Kofleriaceae bacterium]